MTGSMFEEPKFTGPGGEPDDLDQDYGAARGATDEGDEFEEDLEGEEEGDGVGYESGDSAFDARDSGGSGDGAEGDDEVGADERDDGDGGAVEARRAAAATASGAGGQPQVAEENRLRGGAAKAVLEHVTKMLVDDPDSVIVEVSEGRSGLRFSVHVAQPDMGRIIGRRGRTAQAIRTLVRAAAAGDGVEASVDIVD